MLDGAAHGTAQFVGQGRIVRAKTALFRIAPDSDEFAPT